MRSKTLVYKRLLWSFLVVALSSGISAGAAFASTVSTNQAGDSYGAATALDDDAAFESKAETLASTVERHLTARDYTAANAGALELTGRYPRFLKGWMLLGYTRSMTSDFAGSNETYDRALELGAKPDLAYSRKAYNHVRLGEFGEARRCYRSILEGKPMDGEALTQLGYIEAKLGDYGASADYYRRALEVAPDDVDIIVDLATVEAKRGGNGTVKELLEKANLLDPDNTEVLGRLGVIYIKEKKYESALDLLERLVSLEPEDAKGQRNLGAVYYQLADKKSALVAFEKARALGGDVDDLYGPLADCYIAAGRSADALGVIREGIGKGVQEAWLYSLWGNVLEDARDYDGAIAKFVEAARLREAPWSDYAEKQIARQSELKERERIMEGRMQP